MAFVFLAVVSKSCDDQNMVLATQIFTSSFSIIVINRVLTKTIRFLLWKRMVKYRYLQLCVQLNKNRIIIASYTERLTIIDTIIILYKSIRRDWRWMQRRIDGNINDLQEWVVYDLVFNWTRLMKIYNIIDHKTD